MNSYNILRSVIRFQLILIIMTLVLNILVYWIANMSHLSLKYLWNWAGFVNYHYVSLLWYVIEEHFDLDYKAPYTGNT